MREGQMLTDLKISCGITFVVRHSNFSALSDFEIITLVSDAPAYYTALGKCLFIEKPEGILLRFTIW